MPTSLIRIELPQRADPSEVMEFLRSAGIPVMSGAVVTHKDGQRYGIIVIGSDLPKALELLAKAGIEASTG